MGGGKEKKEDRAAQTKAWANLNEIFGISKETAGKFGAKGTAATDAAQNFWQTILSGSRQQLAEAVAPEASAARAAADAAKRQEGAMGTARGGGTAAANRELDDRTRAQIDSLIGRIRPAAAGALQSIGAEEISAMLSALGIGTGATGTVGSQAGADLDSIRRQQSSLWGALIGAPATVAGAWLGGR